eukprot:700344-Prymnesium_polylepis.1
MQGEAGVGAEVIWASGAWLTAQLSLVRDGRERVLELFNVGEAARVDLGPDGHAIVGHLPARARCSV